MRFLQECSDFDDDISMIEAFEYMRLSKNESYSSAILIKYGFIFMPEVYLLIVN